MRFKFLLVVSQVFFCSLLFAQDIAELQLKGNRFFTLATVVRVRQIEVTRDTAYGPDESAVGPCGGLSATGRCGSPSTEPCGPGNKEQRLAGVLLPPQQHR